MAACGPVLEAQVGGVGVQANGWERGPLEGGTRLFLPTPLGRVFLGKGQDLICNSLTPCSRKGLCSHLSAPHPSAIKELSHSAESTPLTSPTKA